MTDLRSLAQEKGAGNGPAPHKIVHITTAHQATDIRVFQKECRTLAKAGYEVVLFAQHDKTETREGVTIRGVAPARSRLDRMFRTSWRVVSGARAERADLYHIHDPELLPWGRWLRRGGAAVVYDMHENLPKDVLDKSWIPRFLRQAISSAIRRVEPALYKGLGVIFAEDSYEAEYGWLENTATVRNLPLVDTLVQLTADDSSDSKVPMVAYVGVVSEDHGVNVTLQALEILRSRGVEVGFVCVGRFQPPELESRLRSYVTEAGLQNIRFHGFLQPEDAWRQIAKCQVGLALLAPQPNYLESYPTKMFEYMALGIPVVVSDFPLYQSIVEPRGVGLTVDPTNPDQVATAIGTLLEDPNQATGMGAKGKQAALLEFNWAAESKRLLDFYSRLLV